MADTVHWVRQGESLWEIAWRHQCSVEALARANALELGAPLRAGRPLLLPDETQSRRPSVMPLRPGPSSVPEEPRLDVEHLTTSAKMSKALELSWGSWPGQIAGAAKAAFSDPAFVMTLIVVMGIYAGLWLTPDPTMLTKALAGTLTVVLLSQFAWEDVYGLARAWFALREQCAGARTLAQLQEAGDTFAKKVGHVGFDLLLFLVMWRVGKVVEPRLTAIGVDRALATAEAQVSTAEVRPGTGIVRPARGEALKMLETARRRANSKDPSRILDALSENLSDAAQKGLAALRGQRIGDAGTLAMLENILLRGGKDLNSFLSHQGVPKAQVDLAKESLLKAQGIQARAQLLRMKTLHDPLLRRAMHEEFSHYMTKILEAIESPPDWARLREAIRTRDLAALVGELGEAIQRTLLAKEYPESEGYRIFANVDCVRFVEGFSRISDWQGVERAEGRSGNARGFYEWGGRLWKSITEVDAMIARQGPGGKWRLVEFEQMKTGKNDQPIRAQEQNSKALNALSEIAAGNKTIRFAERNGKNSLGRDLTEVFDLATLKSVRNVARGTQGKGFERSIPFLREFLEGVAQSMIETGLPAQPITPLPLIATPRQDPASE